jgi:hypothetical protein
LKESTMTATQALKKLSEVSGESALIVADPKDGIAVVVRWEDPERRLAFCVDSHFENEADDHLYLVARAAEYLSNEARKRRELGLAVRLRTLSSLIENECG